MKKKLAMRFTTETTEVRRESTEEEGVVLW